MRNSALAFSALSSLIVLFCSSCAAEKNMTRDQCVNASACSIEGVLTMSSDGHAFIGVLTLDDKSCINVSLPEKRSEYLLGKSGKLTVISGLVVSFPHADDAMEFAINGRRVGYGLCGDKFVFVK
jgi:hypothetical protein